MTHTPTPPAAVRHNRMRDPICPPWCAGHAPGYQEPDGYGRRDHASVDPGTLDVGVELNAIEHPSNLDPLVPFLVLYVDPAGGTSSDATLTPAQARAFAARLVELAEQAEEWAR